MKTNRLFLFCLFALVLVLPLSAGTIDLKTYTFSGTCTVDCVGVGTATLVLVDYTPGTPMTLDNFYSFVYHSDFLGDWAPGIRSIYGTFPADASLPAGLDLMISASNGEYFFTSSGGGWCVGDHCAADAGNNGVWAADAPAGVPEPSTIVLSAAGIAGLALLRRKR